MYGVCTLDPTMDRGEPHNTPKQKEMHSHKHESSPKSSIRSLPPSVVVEVKQGAFQPIADGAGAGTDSVVNAGNFVNTNENAKNGDGLQVGAQPPAHSSACLIS